MGALLRASGRSRTQPAECSPRPRRRYRGSEVPTDGGRGERFQKPARLSRMHATSASPTRPQRPRQGGDSPGGEAAGRRSPTVFIRPEDDSSSYESGRESGPATRGDRLNGTNSSKGCHLRRSRCRKRMIRRGAARSARACPTESAPSTPPTYRALRVAHAHVEISKFQVGGARGTAQTPRSEIKCGQLPTSGTPLIILAV